MRIARISGWLVAVAASAGVGLWSYAIGNQSRAPAITAALNFPFTGTAGNGVALNSLAQRQMKDPKAVANKAEYRIAERAYLDDPLSVTALGIMSMSVTASGDKKTGQALMEAAGQLSRRSSLVANELIKSAAYSGNDPLFFQWLSRAMLTNADVRGTYLVAMAQATAQDRSVDMLAPILGTAPAWADYYWPTVLDMPQSLVNAAKLRMAIAKKPWKQSELLPTDPQLVIRLANNREFVTALSLFQTLKPGGSSRQAGNVLSDGDFAALPTLPPFDWELSSSGSLGASIGDRKLVVSAIPGAFGFAARQLVLLDATNYELSWTLESDQPIARNILTARIGCAEAEDEKVVVVDLAPGERRQMLTLPASKCRWYWFSVNAAVADEGMGVDARFSGISLRPVGGSAKSGAPDRELAKEKSARSTGPAAPDSENIRR